MATHNANEYVRENSTKLLTYCMYVGTLFEFAY